MIVVHIFFSLLFIYIAASVGYLFFFAVAGRFGRVRKYTSHEKKSMIAVLIPSYKDDAVILDTAKQALKLDYPRDKFTVTIIGDGLQKETIAELKTLPIEVVEVSFDISMKSKSINAAFNQLPSGVYDLALILDSDNVMGIDGLQKVNHAYQSGWEVIQCHRTAKNKNTPVAILDALSEEANNTIFRRGHRVAGFSCTLIGSGMAFRYDLLKDIFALPEIQNNPGEDREVDVQLVKRKIVVEYIDDAYVYDEKVQRTEVFEKQRTRWVGTQVDHFRRFMKKDLRKTFPSKTYLNKSFQNILLPRLLFVLLFFFVTVVQVIAWVSHTVLLRPDWPWWLGLFAGYLLTLAIAVPASFYNKETVKAFMQIPVLIISMLKAILEIGKNKKGFIHTPKEFTQADS